MSGLPSDRWYVPQVIALDIPISGRKSCELARTDTRTFVPNSPLDRAEDPRRTPLFIREESRRRSKGTSNGLLYMHLGDLLEEP